LWQRLQHLGKPLDRQVTTPRGHAWFLHVPAEAVCKLQPLGLSQGGQGEAKEVVRPLLKLAVPQGALAARRRALAAKGPQGKPSSPPQTQALALELEDGRLLCTLYRNAQGHMVLQLRADVPQLQEGWVSVTAMPQKPQVEPWRTFVALEPDARGILTGRCVLSEALSPEQTYEIHCEPMPAPHWDGA